jgi:hypothetical protein
LTIDRDNMASETPSYDFAGKRALVTGAGKGKTPCNCFNFAFNFACILEVLDEPLA